jgi:hypothetical protein
MSPVRCLSFIVCSAWQGCVHPPTLIATCNQQPAQRCDRRYNSNKCATVPLSVGFLNFSNTNVLFSGCSCVHFFRRQSRWSLKHSPLILRVSIGVTMQLLRVLAPSLATLHSALPATPNIANGIASKALVSRGGAIIAAPQTLEMAIIYRSKRSKFLWTCVL